MSNLLIDLKKHTYPYKTSQEIVHDCPTTEPAVQETLGSIPPASVYSVVVEDEVVSFLLIRRRPGHGGYMLYEVSFHLCRASAIYRGHHFQPFSRIEITPDLIDNLEPEDGLIWVHDTEGEVPAFTEVGIENLQELVTDFASKKTG